MIEVKINDITLSLHTDPALFSPQGLDRGTAAMLSLAEFYPEDKVLDLGCGYGIVGIYAAKRIGASRVIMSDSDPLAVSLSKQNAQENEVNGITVLQSTGFENIGDTSFTLILSNPPYHADFSVPKHFIEKGFNRLVVGGRMMMVTKRKQWYKRKFIAVFGGVKIEEREGYFVFTAEKRSSSYAGKRP